MCEDPKNDCIQMNNGGGKRLKVNVINGFIFILTWK